MSCCAPGAELDLHQSGPSADEILLASRTVRDGLRRTDLSVPDMHCGACLHKVEAALGRLAGVAQARANLSARRVAVFWSGETPPPVIAALNSVGYAAHLYDSGAERQDPLLSELLRSLAVAGFAVRSAGRRIGVRTRCRLSGTTYPNPGTARRVQLRSLPQSG